MFNFFAKRKKEKQLFIEFEEPNLIPCDCCGENIVRLTRFVYQNDDAFAYYYAEIQPHIQNKIVKCLVVICEFEGDEIAKKIGFPLQLWEREQDFVVTLLNSDETPWSNIDDIEILNREQSLKHHYKNDIFRITDKILENDKEIKEFLN